VITARSDLCGEQIGFPVLTTKRELFTTTLEEENLRFDRERRPRAAYSLRHTYISLRLIEGADTINSPRTAARVSV